METEETSKYTELLDGSPSPLPYSTPQGGDYAFGPLFNNYTSFMDHANTSPLPFQDILKDSVPLALPAASTIYQEFFVHHWQPELSKQQPSLLRALIGFGRKEFYLALLTALITEACFLSNVILIPYLVNYIYDLSVPYWWGIIYTLILFTTNIIGIVFTFMSYKYAIILARKSACSVLFLVYHKFLSATISTKAGNSLPTIIYLTDYFLCKLNKFFFTMVSVPKVIACMIILGAYLGHLAWIAVTIIIVGFAAILTIIPLTKKSIDEQIVYSKFTSELESEFLSKISYIRSLGWTHYFEQKLRNTKYKSIRALTFHWGLCLQAIYILTSDVVILAEGVILFCCALNDKSTITIMTIFGLFTHISISYKMVLFPLWIGTTLVSLIRKIQDNILEEDDVSGGDDRQQSVEAGRIVFNKATLGWKDKPILTDVSMDIPAGHFLIVIGEIATGKSTLASAVIGETLVSQGSVQSGGRIAYVSKPWIPHATIKDNILMGRPYDKDLYNEVIKAVALEEDLLTFKNGDDTIITMGGGVLSGGQQQRLCLARALYADSDIYVLDDCMCSLDPHVAAAVFKQSILDILVRKKKTIVFITNNVHFIHHSDSIALLIQDTASPGGPGRVRWDTYDNLTKEEFFMDYLKRNSTGHSTSTTTGSIGQQQEEDEVFEVDDEVRSSASSSILESTEGSAQGFLVEDDEEPMQKELTYDLYTYYIRAGKTSYFLFTLLLNILRYMSRLLAVWGLTALWLPMVEHYPPNVNSHLTPNYNDTHATYFTTFIVAFVTLYTLQIIMNVSKHYILLVHSNHATQKTYRGILRNLSRAPMKFYQKTKIGLLLNVLQREINSSVEWLLDVHLCYQDFALIILAAALLVCLAAPFFAPFLAITLIFYIPWQQRAFQTLVKLRRRCNSSKSPVFNHIKETIDGIQSIRAFRMQNMMLEKANAVFESYSISFCQVDCAYAWITARIHYWGFFITTGIYLSVLLNRNFELVPSNPSLMSLGIIVGTANVYYFAPFGLTVSAFATGMTVTEKYVYLLQAESESDHKSVGKAPRSKSSPSQSPLKGGKNEVLEQPLINQSDMDLVSLEGACPINVSSEGGCTLEYKDVTLTYVNEKEAALKGVTFSVLPGETIAIVGRTGAGKTSLFSALLRLHQITEGRILLGGTNINNIPLEELRKLIAVIPQMPVLFKDTLRNNLDPFHRHSDEKLCEVLDSVYLSHLHKTNDGLGTFVNDLQMSIGEKQLICLARTILRESPLVIMDEPTAGLGGEIAQKVKNVIVQSFKTRTVLFIAHQVGLLSNFDKVLVMDKGTLSEYGDPHSLLKKKGLFFHLVHGRKKKD